MPIFLGGQVGGGGGQGLGEVGAVPGAFLLTLASVLGLVLFLSHLAREIRVETMMHSVRAAADRTIHCLPSERAPAAGGPGAPPQPPADAVLLPVLKPGFPTAVDEDALLEAAVEADVVLLIVGDPGSSLITGTPMGAAWPRAGSPSPTRPGQVWSAKPRRRFPPARNAPRPRTSPSDSAGSPTSPPKRSHPGSTTPLPLSMPSPTPPLCCASWPAATSTPGYCTTAATG